MCITVQDLWENFAREILSLLQIQERDEASRWNIWMYKVDYEVKRFLVHCCSLRIA